MSLETRVLRLPVERISYMAFKGKDGKVYGSKGSEKDRAQIPTVEQYLQSYVSGRGKEFIGYLHQQGLQPKLDGIGSDQLPKHAVAAIASTGDLNIFLANRNFQGKLQEFAQTYARYGLSLEDATEYVLNHEMVHAAGVQNEEAVEKTLAEYFAHRAEDAERKGGNPQRYRKMAKLAYDRLQQGETRLRGEEEQKAAVERGERTDRTQQRYRKAA